MWRLSSIDFSNNEIVYLKEAKTFIDTGRYVDSRTGEKARHPLTSDLIFVLYAKVLDFMGFKLNEFNSRLLNLFSFIFLIILLYFGLKGHLPREELYVYLLIYSFFMPAIEYSRSLKLVNMDVLWSFIVYFLFVRVANSDGKKYLLWYYIFALWYFLTSYIHLVLPVFILFYYFFYPSKRVKKILIYTSVMALPFAVFSAYFINVNKLCVSDIGSPMIEFIETFVVSFSMDFFPIILSLAIFWISVFYFLRNKIISSENPFFIFWVANACFALIPTFFYWIVKGGHFFQQAILFPTQWIRPLIIVHALYIWAKRLRRKQAFYILAFILLFFEINSTNWIIKPGFRDLKRLITKDKTIYFYKNTSLHLPTLSYYFPDKKLISIDKNTNFKGNSVVLIPMYNDTEIINEFPFNFFYKRNNPNLSEIVKKISDRIESERIFSYHQEEDFTAYFLK